MHPYEGNHLVFGVVRSHKITTAFLKQHRGVVDVDTRKLVKIDFENVEDKVGGDHPKFGELRKKCDILRQVLVLDTLRDGQKLTYL